jgi:hypothetical protein
VAVACEPAALVVVASKVGAGRLGSRVVVTTSGVEADLVNVGSGGRVLIGGALVDAGGKTGRLGVAAGKPGKLQPASANTSTHTRANPRIDFIGS